MKKVLLTIALFGVLLFSIQGFAQPNPAGNNADAATSDTTSKAENDSTAKSDSTTLDSAAQAKAQADSSNVTKVSSNEKVAPEEEDKEEGHAILKRYFIEGGWEFMSIVLVCLIFGLAFAIERLIVLSLKQINIRKFVAQVESRLAKGDIEGAKDVARNTRGPIAAIYYQGLDRSDEGIDIVEKSVASYGSVQMGLLEKGLVWISLFISLAPMLGFMGTVIGMIMAFDKIEAMGDIEPSAVAGGIKVALLTTVAGLIVAIILQIFYNLVVSIIDGIVNKMEDASITLVDMMIKYKVINDEENTK